MANARRVFEGELVCYLIAWIPRAVWADKPIDPEQINPYKQAVKSKALRELEEWQRRRAWRLRCTPPKRVSHAGSVG